VLHEQLPGSPGGGDDRDAPSESLSDDDSEVLAKGGEDEDAGILEERAFLFSVSRTVKVDAGLDAKPLCQAAQLLFVIALIRPGDYQAPAQRP
jgi:hypothetical protein